MEDYECEMCSHPVKRGHQFSTYDKIFCSIKCLREWREKNIKFKARNPENRSEHTDYGGTLIY